MTTICWLQKSIRLIEFKFKAIVYFMDCVLRIFYINKLIINLGTYTPAYVAAPWSMLNIGQRTTDGCNEGMKRLAVWMT